MQQGGRGGGRVAVGKPRGGGVGEGGRVWGYDNTNIKEK